MKKQLSKKILIPFLAAVLVLSSLGVLAGCGGKDQPTVNQDLKKITVVLDWVPNTNHTGLYVALAKDYYKEVGLEVEIIQPPEDGAVALTASGKAQFGFDFQESLAAALTADSPMPVTAVAAIIDHNTSGIMSLKAKGIDTFAKLEGKTYATWDAAPEKAILTEVMKTQGADFAKVNKIPSTVTDAVSAIQSDIDAVWVYEGWDMMAAKVAGLDYNFIKFSDIAPVLDFYTPVLIANNDFLANDPETAKKFMAATVKGYEYCIANPAASADILIAAVPELNPDLIKASQEFLAGQYKAEKPVWGTIDQDRWTNFYDWMYSQGLINKELGSQGFSNDFLPAAE